MSLPPKHLLYRTFSPCPLRFLNQKHSRLFSDRNIDPGTTVDVRLPDSEMFLFYMKPDKNQQKK